MSTLVRDPARVQPAPPTVRQPRRRPGKRTILLAGAAVWILGFLVLHGTSTLTLPASELTDLHRSLNQFNAWVAANRADNPVFLYIFTPLRAAVDAVANLFITTFAATSTGLRLPEIGWLGTVALLTWIAFAIGNARVALLTAAVFTFFGLQGLFVEATYTFALVLTAVLLTLLVGIPLGVLSGVYNRVAKVITPVLDFMQTLPTFVYLAPLALVFLIGPASAVIATVIYAAPPVIRLTAHGIRYIPENTREASDSLGTTGLQRLVTLQLPMARRTIVMGINQGTMAALSMVTIAALIAAPGLGQVVVRALQSLDVGTAVNAGLSIVLLAIVLDRVTTAASRRAEPGASRNRTVSRQDPVHTPRHHPGAGTGHGAVVPHHAVGCSLPERPQHRPGNRPGGGLGQPVDADQPVPVHRVLPGSRHHRNPQPVPVAAHGHPLLHPRGRHCHCGLRAGRLEARRPDHGMPGRDHLPRPLERLHGHPGRNAGGHRSGHGPGSHLRRAMGRSGRVDQIMRPMLDAGQTMPAFVYLVPFLGLFGATRFTAIIAGIIYAAPVAIKITADGIAAISPTVVEAAVASGSTPWQVITKVQLPMARQSLALAANQGLIYVLAMVVVGALVGAGGLGYDVVAGFVQSALFGKGLAAGVAIVFLGILLDRMTQAAAATPARKTPSTKSTTM